MFWRGKLERLSMETFLAESNTCQYGENHTTVACIIKILEA
jgi:hypothetical protein